MNPKKQTKGTVGTTTLKSLINDERTKNKFKELLGNKAAGFLTSLLNTTNGNAQLQEAEPQSVLKAGAIAATLDLPIDPNLGFAYVVPYKRKYKDRVLIGNFDPILSIRIGYNPLTDPFDIHCNSGQRLVLLINNRTRSP